MTDNDIQDILAVATLQQQTTETLLQKNTRLLSQLDDRIESINGEKDKQLFWLIAKVTAGGVAAVLVITLTVLGFYAWDIGSLRTERDELQASVNILNKQTKGIKFGNCKGEVCARLQNPKESFEGGYFILKP